MYKRQSLVRTIIICTITLVVFEATYLWNHYDGSDYNPEAVYFFPTQGLIHTTPGEEVPVMIFGAADQDSSIFSELNQTIVVRTDNQNLEIEESSIDPGILHKRMAPFSICLEVVAEKAGVQSIAQVILVDENGKDQIYNIGEIVIDTSEPNKGNAINLRSHAGGSDLQSPYSFTFKNQNSKDCIVTDIDFGRLTTYLKDVEITVDGKEVDASREIILSKGQRLQLCAFFKSDTGVEVFLVSPTIQYQVQGEQVEYAFPLPSGITGVPDADTFERIYEKYFQI